MTVARKIAFVCLHGSAKSLIAAEYLNRSAHDRGLPMSATTAGPEPDETVPANVIDGLLGHGIDARTRVPERLTAQGLAGADQIVSFGCDLGRYAVDGRPVERWDECPAVSDDFEVAWSFITGRVTQLIDQFAREGAAHVH
jgi:protein-tyrosine-phosphatase